jgi:hypothetical protein
MDDKNAMRSPFPGMDPYLEASNVWRDTHNSLIYTIRAAINSALPDGYAARIEESLYIAPRTDLRPDVSVIRTAPNPPAPLYSSGGVAVLEKTTADTALLVPSGIEEAIPWIAVIGPEPGGIVTAIEVLSPTNKERGPGRDKYLRKRRRFINTSVNVLEIDLLRAGPYTLGAPEARLRELILRWDYLTCLYRAAEPDSFETWPRTLRERLPRVTVPLLEPHEDLALDLQAALDRAYTEGGFARSLNYAEPPPAPALSPEDNLWLDTLLQEQKRR